MATGRFQLSTLLRVAPVNCPLEDDDHPFRRASPEPPLAPADCIPKPLEDIIDHSRARVEDYRDDGGLPCIACQGIGDYCQKGDYD